MKESKFKSYDELPLFLNAQTVAQVLGVSPSSGYELLREKDFRLCGSGIGSWYPRMSSSAGWSGGREARNESRSALQTKHLI